MQLHKINSQPLEGYWGFWVISDNLQPIINYLSSRCPDEDAALREDIYLLSSAVDVAVIIGYKIKEEFEQMCDLLGYSVTEITAEGPAQETEREKSIEYMRKLKYENSIS